MAGRGTLSFDLVNGARWITSTSSMILKSGVGGGEAHRDGDKRRSSRLTWAASTIRISTKMTVARHDVEMGNSL